MSKQSNCRWFETIWRLCHVTVMSPFCRWGKLVTGKCCVWVTLDWSIPLYFPAGLDIEERGDWFMLSYQGLSMKWNDKGWYITIDDESEDRDIKNEKITGLCGNRDGNAKSECDRAAQHRMMSWQRNLIRITGPLCKEWAGNSPFKGTVMWSLVSSLLLA